MRSAFALLALLLCAAPAYAATPAAPAAATTQQASVAITGWRLECNPTKNALACRALDDIVQSNGGLVIGFSVMSPSDGTAVLTMTAPLGISVHTPVGVSVVGGPSQEFPFLTCSQQGCFATAKVNADLLAAMRASKGDLKVTYSVLDSNLAEHTVTATLSLTGFPAVYDRLK